ncbi:MAG: acetyl-CoA synthetase [Ignavibacteria bacterium]|nr:MAG: acetyl-CoA synthetase [Ignavibacteria bacterium]KAF0158563.1 MAG: acetyl-CoA synthetase [Ignavibacteria bacterium]
MLGGFKSSFSQRRKDAKNDMNPISNFFYPKSICVAGASTKEKSIGYEILKSIKGYNYTGKVFPVNPKANDVLGYKCFHSIEEIDEPIDLGIIVVPKQFAEETVDALLAKSVKSIILITAGFKETGKSGEEVEQRIVQKIVNAGARMVGPNCMGVINSLDVVKLNATFVAEKPKTGATGFLSQSGGLGAAVLNSLRESDIKLAHFISVGNKGDLNENDLLHFWQKDENIYSLTFYLESFVNGEDFILPFVKGEITKPAIVLKAGKSQIGMKAASSHTGALSSKDKVVDALLNQFGIIRAETLNELFNTAKGFENFPLPKGNKIAVVTNAGGPGVLCVDSLEKQNLTLAVFSDETKKKLREIVHPEGSVENPVDLLPGGNKDSFKSVIEITCNDDNVDAVISLFVEPVMVEPFAVVESVSSIVNEKPVIQAVLPLPEFWQKYRSESDKKLPLFRNPEDPAEILSNMLFYSSVISKLERNKAEYTKAVSIQHKTNSFSCGFLTQPEIASLCSDYHLPLIKNILLKPAELEKVEQVYYPLVLKGINPNIIHKSELNAVKLNIQTKEELFAAANEIKSSFAQAGFEVNEFLVQQFVKAKHELLIGGFRDTSFGPIIMFGSGGKYVEIFDDVKIKSCYLCAEDIDDIINKTNIGKILHGVRGETSVDLNELKLIIKQCSLMMLENKNFEEFDLNPLIVDTNGKFFAVDVRVKAK